MAEFGALVKQARESRGETGAGLAGKLGVAHSTLVRIERGQLSNPPDPDLFWKLSSALGLSPQQMLMTMGYLRPSEEQMEDAPALSALRPILESRDLTEKQIHQLATMVRGMVEMMEG